MGNPVDYAINHARLTIAALAFLLVAGLVAYVTIPKEAEPDIKIPIVYTLLTQRGISPEDAERLLVKPVETKLKSVANVKEMRATAYEGGAYVLLEFQAGLRLQVGARRRARQGRRGEARPAARCRRADRAGGQSLALSGAGGVARRRPAGAHAAAHRAHGEEHRSSRCRA